MFVDVLLWVVDAPIIHVMDHSKFAILHLNFQTPEIVLIPFHHPYPFHHLAHVAVVAFRKIRDQDGDQAGPHGGIVLVRVPKLGRQPVGDFMGVKNALHPTSKMPFVKQTLGRVRFKRQNQESLCAQKNHS